MCQHPHSPLQKRHQNQQSTCQPVGAVEGAQQRARQEARQQHARLGAHAVQPGRAGGHQRGVAVERQEERQQRRKAQRVLVHGGLRALQDALEALAAAVGRDQRGRGGMPRLQEGRDALAPGRQQQDELAQHQQAALGQRAPGAVALLQQRAAVRLPLGGQRAQHRLGLLVHELALGRDARRQRLQVLLGACRGRLHHDALAAQRAHHVLQAAQRARLGWHRCGCGPRRGGRQILQQRRPLAGEVEPACVSSRGRRMHYG
jgi:hypothetical protein